MSVEVVIRAENADDISALSAVHDLAFGAKGEGRLVNQLRENQALFCSLIAALNERVIGHIALSPMTHSTNPALKIWGLGPMAVIPEFQNRGVGSKLVYEAIEFAKSEQLSALIVLGHPTFYPRFGFEPTVKYQVTGDYKVPDDVFMILILDQNLTAQLAGHVKYHEAFAAL
jgi:putative acetyltransferase